MFYENIIEFQEKMNGYSKVNYLVGVKVKIMEEESKKKVCFDVVRLGL